MASNLLHIKDSYYFEFPKFMVRWNAKSIEDFPDFWIRLDPEYQAWEADQLAHFLESALDDCPDAHDLVHQWEHWQHADHANHGRPFDVFLEMKRDELQKEFAVYKKASPDHAEHDFVRFLNETEPAF